jgi:hypothetical protein
MRRTQVKRVVSISLGSSLRDHRVVTQLLGQEISLERIGTDGNLERARQLYAELDGKVDALGVGGIDLTLRVQGRRYPLRQALKLVADVHHTPVLDGGGLKHTLERRVMQYVEAEIGDQIRPKRGLVTTAVDRYGMALSFVQAGYEMIYGDFMFSLGLPIPLRSIRAVEIMAYLLLPVLGFMPISFLYPMGEKQDTIRPRWGKYYEWPSVIAGDFLYTKRYMPSRLEGKVIVTNTTTLEDVALLRERGVSYLVTTTPRLEGRSFGTNVMEAALVALSGRGRELSTQELEDMLAELDLKPTIERLQPR